MRTANNKAHSRSAHVKSSAAHRWQHGHLVALGHERSPLYVFTIQSQCAAREHRGELRVGFDECLNNCRRICSRLKLEHCLRLAHCSKTPDK